MAQTQDKKVILITGASSGFGLLTSARLAAQNHRVYATMRDPGKKGDLLAEISRRGGTVEILALDVTKIDTIKAAVKHIVEKEGRIDVLFNNAGYGIGGFFEDLTQEEIRAQLDTNFFGQQNVAREVIPVMRRQRSGHIITLTSIAGLYAMPAFGAYNASKWALEGFCESLYYELKPFGIKVCVIEPGTYKTKIFSENSRKAKNFDNPDSLYYAKSQYLSKQVCDYAARDGKNPEDIAILVEKIIHSQNPPFRNIPDMRSQFLFALKRFLPFGIFSTILYGLLFAKYKTRQ